MPPKSPYLATVILQFDGDEITTVPPDQLVEFTYTDNLDRGGSDQFNVTLFDRNAFITEERIISTKKITVQWGYSGGQMSIKIPARILSYQIIGVDALNGVLIQIHGVSEDYIGAELQRTQPYPDTPIHEVVQRIMGRNGWRGKIGSIESDPSVTIEECVDIPDPSFSREGKPRPVNNWVQVNQSDLAFIRDTLARKAVSKHTFRGDYVVGFDAGNVLHFRPRRTEAKRIYNFPDPHGDVIAFSPTFESRTLSRLGGGTVIGRSRTEYGSNLIEVVRTPDSLTIYLTDPKNPGLRRDITKDVRLPDGTPIAQRLTDDFKVTDRLLRHLESLKVGSMSPTKVRFDMTADDPATAAIEVNNEWQRLLNRFFRASLTLIGDPTIGPSSIGGDVIYVNWIVRGQKHYASGTYFVKSVTHTIDNSGTYTSTADLLSNPVDKKAVIDPANLPPF